MTEIKQINDCKTFWKRSTMEIITFTEGSLADIIQLARKDINSLITTIESMQENFDRQVEGHKYTAGRYSDEMQETKRLNSLVESQNSQIESLKAITELAVKGLYRITDHPTGQPIFLVDTLKGIANRTLSEIESLSRIQEGEKP